jgi:hypothetical protein
VTVPSHKKIIWLLAFGVTSRPESKRCKALSVSELSVPGENFSYDVGNFNYVP